MFILVWLITVKKKRSHPIKGDCRSQAHVVEHYVVSKGMLTNYLL